MAISASTNFDILLSLAARQGPGVINLRPAILMSPPYRVISHLIGQQPSLRPSYWLKTFPIKMQSSCQLVHVAEYIQCHYSPRRSSVITCYYHVVSLISFCQGWGANHSLIVTPLSLCVVMGACLLYSDVVFPFSRTMSPRCQSLHHGKLRGTRRTFNLGAKINRFVEDKGFVFKLRGILKTNICP